MNYLFDIIVVKQVSSGVLLISNNLAISFSSAIVRELTESELADFTSKFSSVKTPETMPRIYTRTGDKGSLLSCVCPL